MTPTQHSLDTKRLARTIAIAFLGMGICTLPAWTQDFSGTGRPAQSRGGGSRGGCPNTAKPLTALVPVAAGQGGWTVQSHPTFWVYIPYTLTDHSSFKFVLRDEHGQDVYQTEVSQAAIAPGIIGIALPSDQVAPMEIGKSYTWYVEVYCNKNDRPAFVTGWVKRVQLKTALMQQIRQSTPQQRSQLYAKHLIWYDALTTLAEELRTKSEDRALIGNWQTLLRLPSVGLDAFAAEPIKMKRF